MNKILALCLTVLLLITVIVIAYPYFTKPKQTKHAYKEIKIGNEVIREVELPDNLKVYINQNIDIISVIPREILEVQNKLESGEFEKNQLKNPFAAAKDFDAAVRYSTFDYYGKFLDQDNQPIAGVSLKLLLAQPISGGGWYDIRMQTTTDQNGVFHISNVKGEMFEIVGVEKQGYTFYHKTIRKTIGRKYKNSNKSLSDPAIFYGWKVDYDNLQNVKYFRSKSDNPVADGRNYSIGITPYKEQILLEEGNQGDIVVSVVRSWENINKRWGQEYTIQLKFYGEGATPVRGEYPYSEYSYLAPESGYSSSYTIARNKDDGDWNTGIYEQSFFLLTSDKTYSLVTVYVDPFFRENRMSLFFRGKLNTAKGRLLINKNDVSKNKERLNR